MATPAGVLRARLIQPRLPGRTLARPRLERRLAEGLGERLCLVTAGAGYGKTTLLTRVLAETPAPVVWCACDARIDSVALLLAHLAVGLADIVPGFGAELTLAGPIEAQVLALSNEIAQTVPDRIVLAMDDAHVLPEPVAPALAALVRDLPPQVHLVMASRRALPLAGARLRASGVCEIGATDLALDEEEIAELIGGDRVRAQQLHELTEGWPAGVALALRSGAERIPVEHVHGRLFDYLAEEVMDRLSDRERRFLLDTSVLDRMTADLAQAVTGEPDSGTILEGLVAHGAFTVQLAEGEGWYRYHSLLRRFLRAWLSADPEELMSAHRRAADAWRALGEPLEAVDHLLEAGEFEAALDILEPQGDRLATSTRAPALLGWLARTPDEVWRARPGLLLAYGAVRFGMCEYDGAFASLEEATRQLVAAGRLDEAVIALFRLLDAVEGTGRYSRGLAAAERLLPDLDMSAPLYPAVLIRLATMHGHRAEYEQAEEYMGRALAAPQVRANGYLAAYADVMRASSIDRSLGRQAEGLARIDRATAYLENHQDEDVLAVAMWALAYRTLLAEDLALMDEVFRDGERFIVAATQRGRADLAVPIVTRARMFEMALAGRWDELETWVGQWDAYFVATKDTAWNHLYFYAPAMLHVARGRPAEAVASLTTMREALTAFESVFEHARRLPDMALIALQAGRPELARELVAEGRRAAELTRAQGPLIHADAVGALAWAGEPEGDRMLEEALERTARLDGMNPWLGPDHLVAGPLLARALVAGLGPPGVAARTLASCGTQAVSQALDLLEEAPEARRELAGALVAGPADPSVLDRLLRDRDAAVRGAARASWARLRARPRSHLAVVTLGRFEVRRDGEPVAPATFVRQKARTLLAALIAAGGSAHREQLQLFQREIDQIFLPRYTSLALHQNQA